MSSPSPVAALAWRPLDASFDRIVAALARRRDFWWLDSARPDARLGRFSFAGADVAAELRVRGGEGRLRVRRGRVAGLRAGVHRLHGEPLALLRRLLPPPPADAGPLAAWPFAAGAVGVFGYELGAAFEGVPVAAGEGDDAPDLVFRRVDALVAHEHATGVTRAVALGEGADLAEARAYARARVAALARGLGAGGDWPLPRTARTTGRFEPAHGLDASAHAKAVERIRERIAEGDAYQACLTHRIETPFAGDALTLHRALREASPAPFAAFLPLGDRALVGSSPERFLRVSARGEVESRPIKGTRPRGSDPARDAALRAALAASEKDRAENLMIVDLVRHDLGRVCRTGSVEVPELFAIESYATVHQMVSTVRGRLAPGRDVLDAVAACLPAGSMTGAPKRAAMALLARLEPVRRGFYAGALGYLDVRGGADLAVVIRSATVGGGRLAVHTGGGIVADSEPEAEWAEAAVKARALLETAAAVHAAAGGAR